MKVYVEETTYDAPSDISPDPEKEQPLPLGKMCFPFF